MSGDVLTHAQRAVLVYLGAGLVPTISAVSTVFPTTVLRELIALDLIKAAPDVNPTYYVLTEGGKMFSRAVWALDTPRKVTAWAMSTEASDDRS